MRLRKTLMYCCMPLILGISTSALAITRDFGFYAGLNLGIDHIKQIVPPINIVTSNTSTSGTVTFDKDGLGGRIHGGFLFGENFAAEFGYSMFHRMKYTENTTTTTVNDDETTTTTTTTQQGSIRYKAIDIIAKGMIPFDYGFGIFADAGIGYVRAHVITSPPGNTVDFFDTTTSKNKLTAVYGLGFSYDNADSRFNIGWKRFQKRGTFPSIDFGYIGGSYFFG